MMTRTVRVGSRFGLHLRVAARVAETAARFRALLTVRKDGRSADPRSVLNLLMLQAAAGSEIELSADGDDETAAIRALAEVFEEGGGI